MRKDERSGSPCLGPVIPYLKCFRVLYLPSPKCTWRQAPSKRLAPRPRGTTVVFAAEATAKGGLVVSE